MHVAMLLAAVLLSQPAEPTAAPQPRDTGPDEQVLLAAGLPAGGPELVDFLQQRARLDTDTEALLALTDRLAAVDPRDRAAAATALIARGAVALPVLRRAVNDLGDPDRAARARRCVHLIEGDAGGALPAAAVRLLAQRKQTGAVEALLAYLPAAETDVVVREVAAALSALAFADGKPHPALLKALEDSVALRRAVAGEALARKDQPEPQAAVRKLLRDPKPVVRLRAALALAQADDVEAIPVLIDLLADVAAPERQKIEEKLQELAGEWAPNPSLGGDDEISRRIRRDAWAGWWRNTDGPALLDEFRRRTLTPANHARITAFIEKLGDEEFEARQRAATDLVAFGSLALPLLRKATQSTDLERARRAEECVKEIIDHGKPLPHVAPRLLALRKPAGAVEALLDYLPYAEEDAVADVQSALATLCLRDGKPDPALVKALEDKDSSRRCVAAEAIIHGGLPGERDAIVRLLRDSDPVVRLRVALALAARRDRMAIPVLIESLAEEPTYWSANAEDLLYRLAGDKAAALRGDLTPDQAGRRKHRDAFAAWWKEAGETVDLSVLEEGPQRQLGYTLLVEANGNAGRVLEMGRDGKPRWIITELNFPVDAHVLDGNRVLIAEYHGQRVTERDLKGKIIWKKDNLGSTPTNAQRLPNGNTFIATVNQLMIVDRSGAMVWSHPFPGLEAAAKARDGTIVCLTSDQNCVVLTAAGKEIRRFPAPRNPSSWPSGIDLLANGHILISHPFGGNGQDYVTEVTREGKTVWQAKAPTGCTTATRLPNGHTLLACQPQMTVTEVDCTGKVVKEDKYGFMVWRARRR
jgi:HEAT repeat protein